MFGVLTIEILRIFTNTPYTPTNHGTWYKDSNFIRNPFLYFSIEVVDARFLM